TEKDVSGIEPPNIPPSAPTEGATSGAFRRKVAKLIRDPEAFFADAKNPIVRRLGPAQRTDAKVVEVPDGSRGAKPVPMKGPAAKSPAAPAVTKAPDALQSARRLAADGQLEQALQLYAKAALD